MLCFYYCILYTYFVINVYKSIRMKNNYLRYDGNSGDGYCEYRTELQGLCYFNILFVRKLIDPKKRENG